MSASTSFMLAALRVLHVDSSHALAGIAWTEEQPLREPAQRPTAVSLIHPPKQPDHRDEEAAAWSDLRYNYEQQRDSHPDATLVA
jgi:hypothetical protein